MGYKIVYINSEKNKLPKEVSPDVYQINSEDLLSQINTLKQQCDIQYFVFEDLNLMKNTNLNNLEDQGSPVLFKFKDIGELEVGASLDINNPVWALCSKSACGSHFEDFLEIHGLIKEKFNHEVMKSVNFSFESSLGAIEFATSILEKFSRVIYPEISNLDFFQYNLILRELLTNAVKHGNKMDFNKCILLTIYSNKKENIFGFAVKDQGTGFDFFEKLKSIKNDELRINQRGLFLIREFCSNIYSSDNLIIAEIK